MQGLDDWIIGTHGLELSIEFDGEILMSRFLPSEPFEKEWNQETTIRYLAQKAGYFGDLDEVKDSISGRRFEAYTFKASYLEYRDYVDLD